MVEESKELQSSEDQDERPSDESVTAESELQQALGESQAEAEQWLDRYRRTAAELANYRKRVEREREQHLLRLRMDLMRQLLPILDDFSLALSNIPDDYQDQPWVEGILLINQKLTALLKDSGVEPMEAEGKAFDPLYHDALLQQESEEHPDGVVSEEIRKGYMIGDEVLRPALVAVSKGPGPS